MEKCINIVNKVPSVKPAFLAMAVAFALSSPLTLAQDTGWYAGFNLGESRADIEREGIDNTLLANGFFTNSITKDDQDFAGKILGGYSFNRYFAIEGSYFNLGNFGSVTQLQRLLPPTNPAYSMFGETSVEGLGLDLVGTYPISEKFSAFARAGLNHAWVDEGFGLGPASALFSDRSDADTQQKYGLGLQYNVSDRVSLRTEFERYYLDNPTGIEDKVDMVSLGAVFRFGAPVRAAAPAPAPAPVAAAPAPRPAPAPAPAPAPQPTRLTLSADALFGFDSAEMNTAGRQEMDQLVEQLRGLQYEVLNVTGHTDRIGSQPYNLRLSQRRADTVRDYLIGSGIPAGDITARGINGEQPVVPANQCTGPVNDALKACLQPDRRVEVEVAAVRAAAAQ